MARTALLISSQIIRVIVGSRFRVRVRVRVLRQYPPVKGFSQNGENNPIAQEFHINGRKLNSV